jgi:hypothetical protein
MLHAGVFLGSFFERDVGAGMFVVLNGIHGLISQEENSS